MSPSIPAPKHLPLLQGAEMLACSRESLKNDRVVVLCSDQTIASYDMNTARMAAQASYTQCCKPALTRQRAVFSRQCIKHTACCGMY